MENLGCIFTSETNKTEQEIIKLSSWVDSAGILHHCTFIFMLQMGDMWWDADHPCMTFSCSDKGIQTVTKICPVENCQEVLNTFTASTTATQYFMY